MKSDLITRDRPRDVETLRRLQKLPLQQKIALSSRRVTEFIRRTGSVYVAFSGGKDSTVLLDLVRKISPDVPGVFCDTGLEWPEIRDFVRTVPNIEWIRPKMNFLEVIERYGYPAVSKEVCQKVYEIRTTHSDKLRNKRLHGDANGNGKLSTKWQYLVDSPIPIGSKCCDVMKKRPSKLYERLTGRSCITGTMASESLLRHTQWIQHGCNSYTGRAMSAPLSFWTEEDIWEYIKLYQLPYSEIYKMGYERTGCMFCMFGVQFDGPDGYKRFHLMKKTHPKQYEYVMTKMHGREMFDYIGVPYEE